MTNGRLRARSARGRPLAFPSSRIDDGSRCPRRPKRPEDAHATPRASGHPPVFVRSTFARAQWTRDRRGRLDGPGSTQGQQTRPKGHQRARAHFAQRCGFLSTPEPSRASSRPLLIRGSQVRILAGAWRKCLQISQVSDDGSAEKPAGSTISSLTRASWPEDARTGASQSEASRRLGRPRLR